MRTALLLLMRGIQALVVGGRRHPRCAGALLGLLAVLALAWFVVRSSPLSAVRRVEVRGVSGMDAGAIESALVAAAQRQSTLGVNVGALRAAVAPYHLVSHLQVSASFPHTLRITVSEQLPVATLRDGSAQAAVASDGAVLDPSVVAGAAPTIDVASLPSGHVTDPQLLAELAVLGAAPPVLLHRVARIYSSPNGLTVSMRNGLVVFFGDAARPHAKWISAARVIASPLAAGATYVDVRVPDHPAAGGLAATSSSSGATGTTDGTDSSIAAALTAAMTSGTSAPPSTAGTAASPATTAAGTGTGTAAATGAGVGAGAATGTATGTAGPADGGGAASTLGAPSGASAASGTGYTSTGG
jgi:cell division protein FtsQ